MKKYPLNKIVIAVVMIFFVLPSLSPAQTLSGRNEADKNLKNNQPLYFIEPGPIRTSTRYNNGSIRDIETEILWKPIYDIHPPDMTRDEFKQMVLSTRKIPKDHIKTIVVDDNSQQRGINIVFNTDGSVPGSAVTALGEVETYLESLFTDSVTVIIDVSFANLGGGILGQTGVYYTASPPSWSTTRSGLISDMDGDDTIQTWLPTGSTIPVRYNGGSSTVTNENRCYFAWANYGATIGSNPGTDADMTFNSVGVTWDYNPVGGVSGYCFQSVVAHEVGHALGFISRADWDPNSDIFTMDIYRFQRTDGTGDYNPDTLAEFQTTARLVDWNVPNDDHNSDLISVEYRMSDGSPYQASHFREQSPSIGNMDPALAWGETFYPDFFEVSDITIFDAIGWDYTTVPSYTLTVNIEGNGQVILDPPGGIYLEGTPVQLTAQADTGWLFDHWDEDLTGSINPETITMDSDKTVTANFTAIPYTLTVTIEGSGSVIKNPDQATYIYGTLVDLTAVPDQDWSFHNWTGDDIDGSTDNPETIIMNGNKAVTANFTMNDIVLPEWRNQGQNQTTIEPGGSILLYAEGMDDRNLDWAYLSTNETGEWLSFSGGEWWNHDWNYSKEIIIDHTLVVDDDLTDFPVLIAETSADFISHAQTDGDDFAFVDATNIIQYDHEIEYYNSGTGELAAWVNIPYLSSTEDTVLYMYYGNPSCTNQENPTEVWDSDFLMVQHMTGDTYTELDDSTMNSWDVTSSGGNPSYNQSGKAGRCVDFDGDGDYLKTSSFSLPTDSPHTGSAWVYVYGSAGTRRTIFEGDNDHGISILVYTDERFKNYAHSSGSPPTPTCYSTSTVNVGNPEWYYITTRADALGSELKIYVNGIHEGDPDTITGTINEVIGLNIGTYSGNSNYWMHGKIDELRISNTVRSDSWIKTEYNNMVSPDIFAPVGFEKVRGGGSSYGSPMNLNGAPGEWIWSNFTWQNASIPEGTTVGWRIHYVDSSRNENATDNMSFTISGTPPEYTLTINIVGNGQVTKNPDQLTYTYGTNVELTAIADPGWSFDHWEDDLTGSTNPDTIVMDGDKTVTANFSQDEYTLTIIIEGSGSVSKNPDQATYTYGTPVQLTATADPGWTFFEWSGGLTGNTNPDTIIMDGDKVVTANFTRVYCKADFDQDGDVDLDDFGTFASCYAGSSRPPAPACPDGMDADFDGDGDVDLDDFGAFASCYAGSSRPPAPACPPEMFE